MGTFLFLVLGVGGSSLFIWWLVQLGKQQRERLEQAFHGAALQLGGTFDPGESSFFRNRSPSVTLERDGTRVFVDTYVVNHGKSSTSYTRATARYASGRGPKLHIRRHGALHGLGKMLGMQDLEIGDRAFDEAYVIKGPSEATVRRVLGPDDRRRMQVALTDWWIRSGGDELVVKRVGYATVSEELAAAAELALSVAAADRRILQAVAALPDARLGAGGATVALARGGVNGTFRIDTRECALTVSSPQPGPAVAIDCADPEAARALPEGTLEPAEAAAIRQIGPARLTRDARHVRVSWHDAPAASQVDAAWRVLVALAAPSTSVGAFR